MFAGTLVMSLGVLTFSGAAQKGALEEMVYKKVTLYKKRSSPLRKELNLHLVVFKKINLNKFSFKFLPIIFQKKKRI